MNLTSKLKSSVTRAAGESLLGAFVARGWLCRSKRGRYTLAPRAIVELDGWLNAEYEDYVQKCARCAKTVFSVRKLSFFEAGVGLMKVIVKKAYS